MIAQYLMWLRIEKKTGTSSDAFVTRYCRNVRHTEIALLAADDHDITIAPDEVFQD